MTRFWTKYLLIPLVVLLSGQVFASGSGSAHKENLHEFFQSSHVVNPFHFTSNASISKKGPEGIPYSDPVVESEEEQEIDKIISFKLSKYSALVVPAFLQQPVSIQQLPFVKTSTPAVSGKVQQTQSTLYLVFQVFRI